MNQLNKILINKITINKTITRVLGVIGILSVATAASAQDLREILGGDPIWSMVDEALGAAKSLAMPPVAIESYAYSKSTSYTVSWTETKTEAAVAEEFSDPANAPGQEASSRLVDFSISAFKKACQGSEPDLSRLERIAQIKKIAIPHARVFDSKVEAEAWMHDLRLSSDAPTVNRCEVGDRHALQDGDYGFAIDTDIAWSSSSVGAPQLSVSLDSGLRVSSLSERAQFCLDAQMRSFGLWIARKPARLQGVNGVRFQVTESTDTTFDGQVKASRNSDHGILAFNLGVDSRGDCLINSN